MKAKKCYKKGGKVGKASSGKGTKVRGTGCATKGTMARGPMG